MDIQQIISWVIALAAFTMAAIVIIKTPKKSWFKNSAKENESEIEWAPTYTNFEKLKLTGIHICWILPLMLVYQFVLKPAFGQNILCTQTLGVSHLIWIMSGMILLMILLFLGVLAYHWFYWNKVHRLQQFPLPNQKVWKPQKLIKGETAIRRARMFKWGSIVLGSCFLICMIMLLVLILGLVSPEMMAEKCVEG